MAAKDDKDKAKHEPLKILAASDVHGDTDLIKKLAERAEKEDVDLVVLCGDITMFDSSTDNLIGPFAKKHKKVLLIPGNHETVATTDFLAELYPDTKSIHGYSVKYKDVGIFGAGGATNVGPQMPIDEDEMYDLLKKGWDKVRYLKKKIMVTHIHPSESKIEKFSKFVPGSDAVKKAVDRFKPDILLCGHVHEAEGLEEKIGKTRVINVGRKGKIIRI
ncbi:metallophosphoesterase family protein [Candidatus Woesearchaeota archaeon]|nr:metallophosphoesterase family protein [Candidatus Woesearchaeota archaeon]